MELVLIVGDVNALSRRKARKRAPLRKPCLFEIPTCQPYRLTIGVVNLCPFFHVCSPSELAEPSTLDADCLVTQVRSASPNPLWDLSRKAGTKGHISREFRW